MQLKIRIPNEVAARRGVVANLLLVDDDRDLIDVLGQLLRNKGYGVHTAATGEEGLQVLRGATLPDVIILDVDMPGLDGPEMAHKMLLHDAGEEKIPIILVSANSDLPQIAGRMGTPYFLAKPSDVDSFLKVLDRALRERSAPSSA